jgi:very-short-patch-repair endonuclease
MMMQQVVEIAGGEHAISKFKKSRIFKATKIVERRGWKVFLRKRGFYEL